LEPKKQLVGLRVKIAVILHNGNADISDCAVEADFQKPHSLVMILYSSTEFLFVAVLMPGNEARYIIRKLGGCIPLCLSAQSRGFRGINRAIALFIPRSP